MRQLTKHDTAAFTIQPRWPYRYIFVSETTYERLQEAQRRLTDQGIIIVLTRGLENEGLLRKNIHVIARCVGASLFFLMFPTRISEIRHIFSNNGHAVSSDCIDVGIIGRGERLVLLPFGVFTPKLLINIIYKKHRDTIDTVRATLLACGFSIHTNATEAMQIHCELGDSLGKWRHRA